MAQPFDPYASFLASRGAAPGTPGVPVSDPIAAYIQQAYGAPVARPATPRQVDDTANAVLSGLQSSSGGLMARGKMPDLVLPENAPWYHRAAAGFGAMAGDVPAMIAGAVVGAPATPVGSTMGAFALPMAIREALVDAYTHNYAFDWHGVWEIAKSAALGGAKGVAIGAVTAGAGRVVAPVAEGFFAKQAAEGVISPGVARVGTGVTKFGTEITALTVAASAVEGHVPTWRDFMDNAIILGGVKGAVAGAAKLRGAFMEAGLKPDDATARLLADPVLRAEWEKLKAGELPEAWRGAALEQRIQAALEGDARPEALLNFFMSQKNPPRLDEGIPGDPVKISYITGNEVYQGVLKAVASLYDDAIQAQTRGVVTNKASAVEALQLIAGKEIGPHLAGTAENSGQILARVHLLRSALFETRKNMEALAKAEPGEGALGLKLKSLASLERLAMMLAEVRGVRAEAGRALQIWKRIKYDPTIMGDAEKLIAAHQKSGDLSDLARQVLRLKDSDQLKTFVERYSENATVLEKSIELFKMSILSGLWTHAANVGGNVMKLGWEIPENIIATSAEAARRAYKGDPMHWAQYKARAFAGIIGMRLGFVDGLKVAGEILRGHGEHLEKADVYKSAINSPWVKPLRILSFRALSAEDAFFRTMAERSEAYKMAVDRSIKEGFHPETKEGMETIGRYLERPETGLTVEQAAKVMEQIQQAGAEAVFSQRLGPKAEQFQAWIHDTPASFVLPFIRTPTNILSWAVQHMPLLNLMSGRWRADFAAGGERQARALTRVAVGGAAMLMFMHLAEEGIITGGGLFDPEMRRTKKGAGIEPYSVKIGDTYYSYQRLEPVARLVGLAADLVELMSRKELKGERAKIAAMGVLALGNATISTTYLSGLSNTINAVVDPNRYGEVFLEQYTTALVPRAIGQTAQMIDPHKREVDDVLGALQSQIPFLREKLMPKRDVWGEPQKENHWFAVLPITVSEKSRSKVKTEAARLMVAIADAPKTVMERGPFSPSERMINLTEEQRDMFRDKAGHIALEILAPVVEAPDWERIPDFAKATVIKRVVEGARRQAQYMVLPADAAERSRMRQQIVEKILNQVQKAEEGTPQ